MISQYVKLKYICNILKIGNKEFWQFIKEKVHTYPKLANEFPWGCFPITDENNILVDIRVAVPEVRDEATLLVNIHELAHAYELYKLLGKECIYQVKASEEYACGKEKMYLELIRQKKFKHWKYAFEEKKKK